MKRSALILLVLFVFAFGASAWSVCPEDANDLGNCDTMYVEPWSADLDSLRFAGTPPYFVRVPIYVTSDLVTLPDTALEDSISGFVIPLCYTHTNTSKYCSVSSYWNTDTPAWYNPNFEGRSIFRHIVSGTDTLFYNRMATLARDFSGREWDSIILNFGNGVSHFWLSMVPFGSADQRWWEGSRVLLATMTFELEDTMTICIDTCLWTPSNRLAWAVKVTASGEAVSKIPRPGTGTSSFKVCFKAPSAVREIEGSDDSRPSEFFLSQNYPNPFNPTTNFRFSLSKSAHVKIDIFNIVGQKVRTLVDKEMKPGVYVADWDGKDENGKPVSSGIYFYRMEAGEFSDMKKMVLVK